jgi:diadenosine tetraphosphate (Ap4A) HIT family hydrolase
MMEETPESYWTVVANIVKERPYGPGGQQIKHGTKHFKPGTKVYIIDWYPGMCEDIIVVGMARRPLRFIKVVIRADWVENLRIKPAYAPIVMKKIKEHYSEDLFRLTKEFAETMFETIPLWQEEMKRKPTLPNNN